MKLTVKLLFVLGLAGVLATYSGCGGKKHPATPVTDTQIDALSKTWKVASVTLETVDKTSDYSAFTLTFTGTHGAKTVNFTDTNRPALSAWPASGTYTFDTTSPATLMIRNDGTASAPDDVPTTYTVTATSLQLSFAYAGTGFTGRSTEVKGAWIFNMVPK